VGREKAAVPQDFYTAVSECKSGVWKIRDAFVAR